MGQLFQEHSIDAMRINYFSEPFTKETLGKLIKKTGLKPFDLLRKAEKTFKELELSSETSDDKIIAAMIEHPNLLQRPIVEIGEIAILARPIERVLELLKKVST